MDQGNIFDLQELRERQHVFRDRFHAGDVLATMLVAFKSQDPLVLGIPAGGVPVAERVASHLACPLDVAVVSKISLPWNTEAGYGAVAFDGTVQINKNLLQQLALSPQEVQQGIRITRAKVQRRVKLFRGNRPFPLVTRRVVILVDDGLASGFTLLTAVQALRGAGAENLIVAIPTGSQRSLQRVAPQVEGLYCTNVRSGWSFAVADAYQHWYDVTEEEARQLLKNATKACG